MSIQSTIDIERSTAIDRIHYICELVSEGKYLDLENDTDEECDIFDYIEDIEKLNVSRLEQWTNSMLEKVMDKPFVRYSRFYNYEVINSEDL